MQNKRERQILDLVYASRPVDEIIESERPDFLLRLRHETAHFGVEVAEFYAF